MPSREQYERCAEAGMSQAMAARHLGVSREAVRLAANRYEIYFKRGRQRGVSVGRFDTMTKAAAAFNTSVQAVSQAIKQNGRGRTGTLIAAEKAAKAVDDELERPP